jgi:hypothetical protein
MRKRRGTPTLERRARLHSLGELTHWAVEPESIRTCPIFLERICTNRDFEDTPLDGLCGGYCEHSISSTIYIVNLWPGLFTFASTKQLPTSQWMTASAMTLYAKWYYTMLTILQILHLPSKLPPISIPNILTRERIPRPQPHFRRTKQETKPTKQSPASTDPKHAIPPPPDATTPPSQPPHTNSPNAPP